MKKMEDNETDQMIQVLQCVPLFQELSLEELLRVTKITSQRVYQKYMFVFMEGEEREAVFFVQSGAIKIYKVDEEGNEQVISLLKAGEMFPHVGFFDESPYPATAEVIQDAMMLMIRIDDFDNLMLGNPQIAMKVMKIMGQKILDLQQRLQEMISGDVRHRVIHSLIRLAREYGHQKQDVFLEMPITNQDFANMVGTSRESINRTLNQLKKEKLIEVNRRGILIYDLDKLSK